MKLLALLLCLFAATVFAVRVRPNSKDICNTPNPKDIEGRSDDSLEKDWQGSFFYDNSRNKCFEYMELYPGGFETNEECEAACKH